MFIPLHFTVIESTRRGAIYWLEQALKIKRLLKGDGHDSVSFSFSARRRARYTQLRPNRKQSIDQGLYDPDEDVEEV